MVQRFRFDDKYGLSGEACRAYADDGVIMIEGFVSPTQCDLLKKRALELVVEYAPAAPGTIFSTLDNGHARDGYFEQSANGIGVFFEEGAFADDGELRVPLEQAVNKLGHAMHDLDPLFNAFSRGKRLQAVADGIGLVDPKLVQSMYIFKQPGIGGEVVCHQDSTFLYTEPSSVVGFWFAIEDAHRSNGCLGGLPGEHRKGLKQIYRKHSDGQLKLETVRHDLEWDMSKLEWLEAPKGTLVVFNGEFPHLSEPNRSAVSRHAYTLHAISGTAHYPAGNWIQRSSLNDLPFSGFIAGVN